ncbi:MAG: hypothetical protein ACOCQY_04760, partial [Halorhabdus sp.]
MTVRMVVIVAVTLGVTVRMVVIVAVTLAVTVRMAVIVAVTLAVIVRMVVGVSVPCLGDVGRVIRRVDVPALREERRQFVDPGLVFG